MHWIVTSQVTEQSAAILPSLLQARSFPGESFPLTSYRTSIGEVEGNSRIAAFFCIQSKAKRRTSAANRMMFNVCLLYTSPSPRDLSTSRMPSSA